MSWSPALKLLRERAVSTTLRDCRVDAVQEVDEGHRGLFLPPMGPRKTTILLRRGRSDLATLMTLCHEIGHFWSFATARRGDAYARALACQQRWESKIDSIAHNVDAVLCYPRFSAAPKEVQEAALESARQRNPNPLSHDERHEILAEEVRAWCFGCEVAVALGVDIAAFSAEADASLTVYYAMLAVPAATWTPAACDLTFDSHDREFVTQLTTDSQQA